MVQDEVRGGLALPTVVARDLAPATPLAKLLLG